MIKKILFLFFILSLVWMLTSCSLKSRSQKERLRITEKTDVKEVLEDTEPVKVIEEALDLNEATTEGEQRIVITEKMGEDADREESTPLSSEEVEQSETLPAGEDGQSTDLSSEGEEDESIYKVRRGDVLEVLTWREADFSKEIPVRIDGKISFPLLDDIQAEGRSTTEIREDIENGLKEFIKNPLVSVSVRSYGSQKFYILGEVKKTGEYDLVKNLTVLQAFALAEGFTEWASKKEIILIRREDDIDRIIRINYKKILKGRGLRQNILIQSDDTIIVP